MKKALFLLIILLISSVNIFSQNFELESAKSRLDWKGSNLVSAHNGIIDIKNGNLNKSNDKISGNFEIDMTSIKNLDLTNESMNKKLISHLKSEDFFNIAKFPTSYFTITKSQVLNSKTNSYQITGNLTIKGITKEVTFPATINFISNYVNVLADFSIDRTKWEVKYGSGSFFDDLGDKAISNDIEFKLNITALQK